MLRLLDQKIAVVLCNWPCTVMIVATHLFLSPSLSSNHYRNLILQVALASIPIVLSLMWSLFDLALSSFLPSHADDYGDWYSQILEPHPCGRVPWFLWGQRPCVHSVGALPTKVAHGTPQEEKSPDWAWGSILPQTNTLGCQVLAWCEGMYVYWGTVSSTSIEVEGLCILCII